MLIFLNHIGLNCGACARGAPPEFLHVNNQAVIYESNHAQVDIRRVENFPEDIECFVKLRLNKIKQGNLRGCFCPLVDNVIYVWAALKRIQNVVRDVTSHCTCR